METLNKFLKNSKFLLVGFFITASIIWYGNMSYSTESQQCFDLSVSIVESGDFFNKVFCYQGVVSSVVESKKYKATYIFFKENIIPTQIAVSIRHNLGELKENIEAGDTLKVKGTIYQSENNGKIYITPLSIDDVNLVNDAPVCSSSIPPNQLSDFMDKTVSVVLSGLEAKPFESKSGKEHLSLKFTSGAYVFQGIIWEGSWDKSDIEKVKSKKPLCVTAKVGTHKKSISLDVKKINYMENR